VIVLVIMVVLVIVLMVVFMRHRTRQCSQVESAGKRSRTQSASSSSRRYDRPPTFT
jgi:uncharacterized membrane protein